jgi:transposase InsO family protein
MQIKGLHKNMYRLNRYALSQEKCDQLRQFYEIPVRRWQSLREEKVSEILCAQTVGISRATYYRYQHRLRALEKGLLPPTRRPKTVRTPTWGAAEKQLVLRLRRENPTYGKFKISIILKRDHGLCLSESTVGRLLKHLMSKGLITKSLSALRPKRKRSFKSHAKAWTYGMKATKPGEMVQIDHMSVTKNGFSFKDFGAWDPLTKTVVADVYSNASSQTAKRFLEKVIKEMPFPVRSIQVDGGSEFMKHFEQACADQGISLYVLPPKRPQWNGGVERSNRTFREEFYAKRNLLADSLGAMRFELAQAVSKYNTYRPHFNLKGLTPLQYTLSIFNQAA